MKKKKIAVIGAGIAGLTCAYELQKEGYEVVVYESESYVGGRMSTRITQGFPMDIGANHLANVYTAMRGYAAELGLQWKPMEFLNYRIYKEGKLLPLMDGIGTWSKFRLAIQALLHKRHDIDFFDLSTAALFDTTNAEHFTKKKISQEALDYLVDPFVSAYQFHGAKDISLSAVYGMIVSNYTNRKDWALHQLEGGMKALPEALASHLDVRLGTRVTRVVHGHHGVHVHTGDDSVRYDDVVFATTATTAMNLLDSLTQAQHALLAGTEYAATIAASYIVPKKLLGDLTICWVPEVESQTITGYTNEAMKGTSLIQDDKTLIIAWTREDFARAIIDKSDEQVFETIKRELLSVCPLISSLEDIENHDLQRWHEAMPKFTHGHISRVKAFEDSHQGEKHIYFTGDYMNAPWTEGALRNGKQVAHTIIQSS